ncbi:MADS-box transcription factor 20 [Oryza glaberrima]|uniref:MADS-box transcription factor 20 n=1 Tax=Oryza glaberrima TaxID=4538 RepID=UPI00224C60E1|nr:MADS-box transcription factor 20 [Oryza glaberrima]
MMGRGKVQVRRIENEVSRQVTFSKRRPGLLKKAHEIAVLCDVDVAAIVFSAKGNLFHYASSHTTMERILEKYDRHELLSEGNNVIEEFPELEGSMSYDHIKLRGKIEALKKSQRNLMGQELDSLTLQDIQQLENQIDTSLNNIRSRKNNLLLKSIAELRQKEKLLMEKNTILEKKITELETLHTSIRASPTKAAAPPACNTADAFVPNLNICCGDSGEPETVTAPLGWTSSNNGLPWWMLQSSSNG